MTFQNNYRAYEVNKREEIIKDTVKPSPYKYPIMENSTENGIRKAAKGIIDYLQYLQPEVTTEIIGNKKGHYLEQLVSTILEYTLKPYLRV